MPKPVHTTYLESRVGASHPWSYSVGEFYDDLIETTGDDSVDKIAKHETERVALRLRDLKRLRCLVRRHQVLNEFNLTSKLLQNTEMELFAVASTLGTRSLKP